MMSFKVRRHCTQEARIDHKDSNLKLAKVEKKKVELKIRQSKSRQNGQIHPIIVRQEKVIPVK
jgi:hypothetical protein